MANLTTKELTACPTSSILEKTLYCKYQEQLRSAPRKYLKPCFQQ